MNSSSKSLHLTVTNITAQGTEDLEMACSVYLENQLLDIIAPISDMILAENVLTIPINHYHMDQQITLLPNIVEQPQLDLGRASVLLITLLEHNPTDDYMQIVLPIGGELIEQIPEDVNCPSITLQIAVKDEERAGYRDSTDLSIVQEMEELQREEIYRLKVLLEEEKTKGTQFEEIKLELNASEMARVHLHSKIQMLHSDYILKIENLQNKIQDFIRNQAGNLNNNELLTAIEIEKQKRKVTIDQLNAIYDMHKTFLAETKQKEEKFRDKIGQLVDEKYHLLMQIDILEDEKLSNHREIDILRAELNSKALGRQDQKSIALQIQKSSEIIDMKNKNKELLELNKDLLDQLSEVQEINQDLTKALQFYENNRQSQALLELLLGNDGLDIKIKSNGRGRQFIDGREVCLSCSGYGVLVNYKGKSLEFEKFLMMKQPKTKKYPFNDENVNTDRENNEKVIVIERLNEFKDKKLNRSTSRAVAPRLNRNDSKKDMSLCKGKAKGFSPVLKRGRKRGE